MGRIKDLVEVEDGVGDVTKKPDSIFPDPCSYGSETLNSLGVYGLHLPFTSVASLETARHVMLCSQAKCGSIEGE